MIEVKKNIQKPKGIIFDSEGLLVIYEELRSCVLGNNCTFSHPSGLDLFLKKGFLKWIQVQTEDSDYYKPFKGPEIMVKKPEFLPQGLESEITLLLANMILEERGGHVSA